MKLNKRGVWPVVALLAVALVANGAFADLITPEVGNTTVVNGGSVVIDTPVWWADMGEYFGNGRAYVVPIQLPTLPAGATFGSVDLAFGHNGPGAHPVDGRAGFFGAVAPDYNLDLYGLSRVSADADVIEADHFSGPSDVSATLVQDNFMDPDSPGDRAVIHTDGAGDLALESWLNLMYDNGANAGMYVFVRLNPDGVEGTLPYSGYQVMTAGAGGAEEKPALTYTVVPEPATFALMLAGMLAVGRRRR